MNAYMNKQEILSEIKRLAKENDGKAPGFQRFSSETGLRKADWYPMNLFLLMTLTILLKNILSLFVN